MAKTTSVRVRTRKFMNNPLLARKQMVVDMLHPGQQSLTKEQLKEKIAEMYKVNDINRVFLFGFNSCFGGGKTTGYCFIYETIQDAKKFEPRFRLIRQGLNTKTERSRKQKKEKKNRAKKTRGKEKTKILRAV